MMGAACVLKCCVESLYRTPETKIIGYVKSTGIRKEKERKG